MTGEMTETLAQVHGPDYVAGIVLWDDKVVEAAPKVKFMKGWSRDRVRTYCANNKLSVIVVHELRRTRPWPTAPD
jgi:hypothetical protein